MILGGYNKETAYEQFDIYDLTVECMQQKSCLPGKLYMPGAFDPIAGTFLSFAGYCDSSVKRQETPVRNLMCTCRSVQFQAVPDQDFVESNRDSLS